MKRRPSLPSYSEEDLAYDGSDGPQKRPLTPRERDILCRVITDIYAAARHQEERPIRLESADVPILLSIRDAIDPRS